MAPITQVRQVRPRTSLCKPCEILLSGESSAHGIASQDISYAAASCQESTLSEPSRQPCSQSGTAPSTARVSRPRSSCRRSVRQKSQLQWAGCCTSSLVLCSSMVAAALLTTHYLDLSRSCLCKAVVSFWNLGSAPSGNPWMSVNSMAFACLQRD